jgi:restriction endonuclease
MASLAEPTIFVWRDRLSFGAGEVANLLLEYVPRGWPPQKSWNCPLCGTPTIVTCNVVGPKHVEQKTFCPDCGRRCDRAAFIYPGDIKASRYQTDVLRQFGINDKDLLIGEVATHLVKHFSDVEMLAPRRFEELIEAVFKQVGYRTRLTQATRDGGYDISLLETATGEQAIVECKRYRKDRKVSVGIVRDLIGVQLIEGINKAYLVTTSDFTKAASDAAERLSVRKSGYDLDLVDGDRLLSLLKVYNEELPDEDTVNRLSRRRVLLESCRLTQRAADALRSR